MTNRILIILILLLVVLIPVQAQQTQVDIGINIPTVVGITANGQNLSEQLPFTIPIPDIMASYYLEVGPVDLGIGIRGWTLIIASWMYPIISAEMEMGPFVINSNIGGGIFGYSVISGQQGFETGQVFIPEVSALYKINDFIGAGVGVLGIYVPELTTEGMGYSINLIVRFTYY